MRKLFAIALLCIIVTATVFLTSCNNNDSKKTKSPAGDSATAMIARGEYLANHVANCMDCHSQRDFTRYGGPVITGTEGGGGTLFDHRFGLPGKIYGKNITPDNETGIGTWTDDQILRALTQGISKNGDTLFPLMPYPAYNHMAKDDLMSIIAYIRTLKPIRNTIPTRELMMPIALAYPAKALQVSIENNVRPNESDKVKYGEYLTTMADCGNCHSPLTQQGPDMSRKFAGGYPFDLGTWKVVSANITSDSTGIGTWTEERFLGKFTPYREEKNYNFSPGKMNTVMPVTLIAGMKDSDLRAIFAYLKSTTPIKNEVEKYPQ